MAAFKYSIGYVKIFNDKKRMYIHTYMCIIPEIIQSNVNLQKCTSSVLFFNSSPWKYSMHIPVYICLHVYTKHTKVSQNNIYSYHLQHIVWCYFFFKACNNPVNCFCKSLVSHNLQFRKQEKNQRMSVCGNLS